MFLASPLRRLSRPRPSPRPGRKHRPRPLAMQQLEDRLVPSSTWIEQGPGPILGAFNAVIPNQNNPEVGAVAGVAVDPNNANVVYAATVNGGVWKTTDANDLNPNWTPLTDT